MYKVVIVDDEEIIVRGLVKVLPWERYGCEVAGVAHDANTGQAVIRQHHPDILITDIRMPDGDGLSMLAGLKSEFPDMQVTVLTGFRDFYYAQQAISLGVTRFLLKPSKMDELTEALTAMLGQLERITTKSKDTLPKSEQHENADTGDTVTLHEEKSEAAGSFIVRQAVSYIEEHCTEKISLSDVADSCYVSQWHLSKLLNKYTEQNFYDILNTARIEKAKKLMLDPSLRIGDISEMVGYIDTPHFSRVFKKIEGVSANEYRNAKLK